MFERLARHVVGKPVFFAVLVVASFCLLAAGTVFLNADFSVRGFFSEKSITAYEDYQQQWGVEDSQVIVVVTAKEESLLTHERISLLEQLITSLEKAPFVVKVTGFPSFVRMKSEEDTIVLKAIRDGLPTDFSSEEGKLWTTELLADPVVVPNLLAKDATAASLVIEVGGDGQDIQMIVPKVEGIRSVLGEYSGRGGLEFSETGLLVLRADFFKGVIEDQMVLFPSALALMLLVLTLAFRSLHGVLIPITAAFLPVGMIFGVMGYYGEPLGMVNNVLTTLLPAIALADAIHILLRFHEELRGLRASSDQEWGVLRREAIAKTMKHLGAACFFTSLTTMVGFGSLYLADMEILRRFGVLAATGIFFSYGTVLFIMPLLLSLTRQEGELAPLESRGQSFLLWSARLSSKRPRAVLVVTAVLVAIFIYFGDRVVVNNKLTNLLYDGHVAHQATALVEDKLGGFITYEVDLKSDQEIFKDPGFMKKLYEVEKWLLEQPEIRGVVSPVTLIAQENELLNGGSGPPDDRNLLAQLYLLLEGYEELEGILDYSFKRGRIVIRTRDEGANAFASFEEALLTQFNAELGAYPVEANVTGATVLAYRGVNDITFDLRRGLFGAFLVIALIIALKFKSLLMVLIALVANGIPLIVGYGVLGIFNWDLDPTSGLVFTVGLGIAVDDTIHLLVRYFEERDSGLGVDQALERAVCCCGGAVALTSALLVVGFGIGTASMFSYLRAMGVAGSAIIIAALLCDLYVLPAMLKLMSIRETDQ